MASSTATPTDGLSDVVKWRARAEFFEVEKMLDYRDAEYARTAQLESGLRMKLERSAVALAIGEATGLSEGQVVYKLAAADRVRSKAPAVWDAFGDGLVDFARVRDISAAVDQLRREESVRRLDATVIPFATTHTGAELRQWLRRFVQRVEADLAVERAKEARAGRHVSVKHTDDSMAWLNAYLPSHEAAAIEAKIHQAARQTPAEDDDRTTRQREADLLVAWCLGTKTTTGAISANIAVTIGADVLAGFVPGFAESADGRWAVPADWITTVVAHGGAFWHRIVVDPVTDDVLAHEYLGRYAPDILNIALQFLHQVCQAPGCMVPAFLCDMDHREPHPRGPTTGDNMGPLCRRHHNLKGHGLLHWSTTPPRKSDKPIVVEIYRNAPAMEYTG
jgi:hypothetical protein